MSTLCRYNSELFQLTQSYKLLNTACTSTKQINQLKVTISYFHHNLLGGATMSYSHCVTYSSYAIHFNRHPKWLLASPSELDQPTKFHAFFTQKKYFTVLQGVIKISRELFDNITEQLYNLLSAKGLFDWEGNCGPGGKLWQHNTG